MRSKHDIPEVNGNERARQDSRTAGAGRSRRPDERGRKAGCGASAVLHRLLHRIGGLAADCERTSPIADPPAFCVAGAGHAGACGGEAHRTGRARLEPSRNDFCSVVCVAADDCELAGFPLCERTFRELARAAVQPYVDQFCRVHRARVARGRGGRSDAGNPAARRKEAGMSRFTKELRVIPKAAWIVAWFAYLCMVVPLFFFVAPTDPEIGKWPRWGQALVVYGSFLLVVALVALIGYVYGDAKRRQMRYVMWTLLAIFIPNGIGMILYFILRDPLPEPCPGCGHV